MTTPRNVLLITVDQWSGAYLGCDGHPAVQTPTLDSLAQAGVRFPNAYSECPVCIPARRSWMSGLHPWGHGVLGNRGEPMPAVPTLAQCFRDRGYQAYAVGKLHVHPRRQRIGFDDVLLDDEGRGRGSPDDYELYLGDRGHPGQRFANGMGNNCYEWRPWHLDESLHPTAWASREMARYIRRKDPLRPAFWYLSYSFPHPPLVPPRDYLAMYRPDEIPLPAMGSWVEDAPDIDAHERRRRQAVMAAYFAQCTYIDHQLRVVIGTLREIGELDRTVICFTADHGEQLGTHDRWAKGTFYETSARVPFLLLGATDDDRFRPGSVDERLVGQEDLMPTLLDAAGWERPAHATGSSVLDGMARTQLLGAFGEIDEEGWAAATRMVRTPEAKLIWCPNGNRCRLFDMQTDRTECHDRSDDPAWQACRQDLEQRLIAAFPEPERQVWVQEGRLAGTPTRHHRPTVALHRALYLQRGIQWPPV